MLEFIYLIEAKAINVRNYPKRTAFAACVILLLSICGMSSAQTLTNLNSSHNHWLNEEVESIISEEEKNYFLSLEGNKQRDTFISAFWKAHDPTPGTKANEFQVEHYRRLKIAQQRYGTNNIAGHHSVRGKIYIKLGEPVQVVTFKAPLLVSNLEAWLYPPFKSSGIGYDFYILFFRKDAKSDYAPFCPGDDAPSILLKQKFPGSLHQRDQAALKMLFQYDQLLGQLSLSMLPDEHRPVMHNNRSEILRALKRRNHAGQKLIKSLLAPPRMYDDSHLARIFAILDGKHQEIKEKFVRTRPSFSHHFIVLRDDNSRAKVLCSFQIESKEVSMKDYFGKCYVVLRISLKAFGSGNVPVAEKRQFVSASFDSWEIHSGVAGDLIYIGDLQLNPGTYTVEMTIDNPLDGKRFVITDKVAVSQPSAGQLSISPPVLQSGSILKTSIDGIVTWPYVFDDAQYCPVSNGSVRKGKDAEILYQMYVPRRQKYSTVEIVCELVRHQTVVWHNREKVFVDSLKPSRFYTGVVKVPAGKFASGTYSVRIHARTPMPPEAKSECQLIIDERKGVDTPTVLLRVTE